jgi:hypothetical protein
MGAIVERAQRTEHVPVVGGKGNTGIRPDLGPPLRQAWHRLNVGNYERASSSDHVSAERGLETFPAG